MSEELQQGAGGEGESLSFLDQAINATSQTAPDRTKELLTSLTQEAMSGTVTWNKNLTATIEDAVAAIDAKCLSSYRKSCKKILFRSLKGLGWVCRN